MIKLAELKLCINNFKDLKLCTCSLNILPREKFCSTSRLMELEKNPKISNFLKHPNFTARHIGPSNREIQEMLKVVNSKSLDDLINETIPSTILLPENVKLEQEKILGKPLSEHCALMHLKNITEKNILFKNYIGCGYNPVILPPIISKLILENPAWYTSYTPYQAEISQGRLESLLNFQTLIIELTGLPISNASLLDESTSAVDAMNMAFHITEGKRSSFFISDTMFPFIKDTIRTMAHYLKINIIEGSPDNENILSNPNIFGGIVQNPDNFGRVCDYTEFAKTLKRNGAIPIINIDLLSLQLTKTPAEMGFDIAVGSAQRFGVPMYNGGPYAGFLSAKEEYTRQMPGRIVGISRDILGKPGYRLSLQTREQHIRRNRATSNICTAEALMANMAAFYAIFHGKQGLLEISKRINIFAGFLSTILCKIGYKVLNKTDELFDTVAVDLHNSEITCEKAMSEFSKNKINIRHIKDGIISLTLNERVTLADLEEIIHIFYSLKKTDSTFNILHHINNMLLTPYLNKTLQRVNENFMEQEIFHKYKSENQIMRYIISLQRKDISLCNSMIPLGSCTMKANSASELYSLSLAELSDIHPFSPLYQMKGSYQLFKELSQMLLTITQFHSISFQPKSGAHGELTGLLTIRRYFESIGEKQRNICLIPASSHGTNFASASFSGLKVIVISTDEKGNVNINDLREKAQEHKDKLCCLMVTYPSTHGVYEERIKEIVEIIHLNGGQLYMDGANMNAQVLLTSPGTIGADCCHLNLHKTFSIPHGGGGPASGPICVKKHLASFLPGHFHITNQLHDNNWSTSSSPYGNAGLLPITYMYLKMLGTDIKKSTQIAILNANYMMERLSGSYKILYRGKNSRCAHEFIIDVRDIKKRCLVSEEDIAKRLMDYGFHAPTISFPVPGSLMTEPTESEDKEELDRFCEAMIEIRREIREIEEGKADIRDNVLKNAPHTEEHCIATRWSHPYTREKAAFPLGYIMQRGKFWPSVARIENVYGDLNLRCSC